MPPWTAGGEVGGHYRLPHPRQPRQGPSEDVFGSDTSKYVLRGSLAGLVGGEGVAPACLTTGRPELALGNPLFFMKIREKCSKMGVPQNMHDFL